MKTQRESPLHFTCDRPDLTLVRLAKTLRRDARRDRKPQLGQPEVQNLQSSLARNLQVAGLEITMNYPVVIRCRQAFRKLHAQTEHLLLRQRSASHLLFAGHAQQQRQDQNRSGELVAPNVHAKFCNIAAALEAVS